MQNMPIDPSGRRVVSKVVVDDALCEKLNSSDSITEVCGKDGRTVGFFMKPDAHAQLLRGWAGSEVSAEELEKARQEYRQGGGRTLAEVFAELRRRGIPGVPAE
jgi:hypothetical protein